MDNKAINIYKYLISWLLCNKWFVLPLYKDTLFFNNAEPWLFLFSVTGPQDAHPNRRHKSTAVTPQVIPYFRPINLAKVAQSDVAAEWEQRYFRWDWMETPFFRWDVCRFARNLLFILWGITPPFATLLLRSESVANLSPTFLCAPSGLDVASFIILSFSDMFPSFFPLWKGKERENDRITNE